MTDEETIWRAIVESNDAWTGGTPRDVAELFHEKAVMIAPGLTARLHGRDAVVETFVDYCRQADTHVFEELDHSVDVFGDTAVATYRFHIRYETEGELHDEVGQEVLVLVRNEDRWQIVWRTQIPLPAD